MMITHQNQGTQPVVRVIKSNSRGIFSACAFDIN